MPGFLFGRGPMSGPHEGLGPRLGPQGPRGDMRRALAWSDKYAVGWWLGGTAPCVYLEALRGPSSGSRSGMSIHEATIKPDGRAATCTDAPH
jgi:hypothetical protein